MFYRIVWRLFQLLHMLQWYSSWSFGFSKVNWLSSVRRRWKSQIRNKNYMFALILHKSKQVNICLSKPSRILYKTYKVWVSIVVKERKLIRTQKKEQWRIKNCQLITLLILHCSLLIVLRAVELEGVEPSSKQAVKMLSTCLAFGWLSGADRPKASQSEPYSLFSHSVTGTLTEPSQLFRCPIRNTVEKGFPGDNQRLISEIKQPICKNNCRHLLAVRIGYYGTCSQRPACLQSHFPAVKTDQPRVDCKDTKNKEEQVSARIKYFPCK